MSLEEFLWKYCADDQNVYVLIYEPCDRLRVTTLFDMNPIDILGVHEKRYHNLLQHSLKSVEAKGDTLEIIVWDHWIKTKED